MDFMKIYMDQGRFGEFVENIIELDDERKKKEEEKENDNKLWSMFIHSMSDKSFNDWKSEMLKQPANQGKAHTRDEDMTQKDIQNIMDRFFP